MVDDTVLTHSIHGDKYFQPVVLKASVGITLTSLNDSLLFDDTTQDVLCLIGPPDSTISKERDQMGIHKIGKDDVSAQRSNHDYFWNYFDMGIDLLFDGENHTIKKIIIHSNFLGHHEVNRYSKCNFKFENLDIDHKSTLQDVKNVMGAPLGPPVIFNLDESPFGCSSFHGYKGILFEVLKNGHIASVSLWKTN
ncbi:hypothetical protein BC833DRAFT_574829 [Globomyces pollinis-pini]|nr:hypothetical protein BC833DRAFT_574829 [Globomyces pollinis-pini]